MRLCSSLSIRSPESPYLDHSPPLRGPELRLSSAGCLEVTEGSQTHKKLSLTSDFNSLITLRIRKGLGAHDGRQQASRPSWRAEQEEVRGGLAAPGCWGVRRRGVSTAALRGRSAALSTVPLADKGRVSGT